MSPQLFSTAFLVAWLAVGVASATPVAAYKADDVVDFMGVSIRMNSTSVLETSILPGLEALNVRHVRGNFPDFARTYNNVPDRVRIMYDMGVRGVGLWGSNSNGFSTLPDGTRIASSVGSPQAAVEALEVLGDFAIGIEGPNEPDLFYDGYQYDGFTNTETDLAASRAYHNDMYAAIQANPSTAGVPVITASVASPDGAAALGAVSHDKVNLHYYPHSFIGDSARPLAGNFEGSFEDFVVANLASQGIGPGDPTPTVVLTETGYNTSPGDPVVPGRVQGMSDLGSVKHIPRLMADLFRVGRVEQQIGTTPFYLERAYLFRLDHNKEPTSEQQYYWSIVNDDGSPTPAFIALEGMIDLLREAEYDVAAEEWQLPEYEPAALDLSINNALPSTRHVLLQKSTGEYVLMMWQDVESYDLWNDVDLNPGDDAVTISVAGGRLGPVTQHRYDASGALSPSAVGTFNDDTAFVAGVPDSVTFFTFSVTGLPGDYNGDGVVDAADYTAWREGDAPDLGSGGYDAWVVNYGASSGSAATPAPEPGAAALLSLLLAGAPTPRCRWRSHR